MKGCLQLRNVCFELHHFRRDFLLMMRDGHDNFSQLLVELHLQPVREFFLQNAKVAEPRVMPLPGSMGMI